MIGLYLKISRISIVWEIVAFVSKYRRSPRSNFTLNGESLYTCKKIKSEIVFFVYFVDEIVAGKNLRIGLLSMSDMYSRCLFCFIFYWWTWLSEKFYTFPASALR